MNEIYLDESDYTIMCNTFCPTKFYTITFDGWKTPIMSLEDNTFREITELASKSIVNVVKIYKETHAFTQPQFFFKPDGTFGVKIGTLENERYESLKLKSDLNPIS